MGCRHCLEKSPVGNATIPTGLLSLQACNKFMKRIVTFMWHSNDMFHYISKAYERNKCSFRNLMKHVIRMPHKCHNSFHEFITRL